MKKHIILLAGNIGAGKTSLTECIGARLNWRTEFESVADNPYLPDFYANMRAWAFHLQVYFLGHRAEQYLQAAADPRPVVLDRSLYEDAHIFARALHHLDNLNERDYLAYRRVFALVNRSLPPPSLLIYLKAPVSVLLERIRRRGRGIETGITAEYLTLLDTFYTEWLQTFDTCPILTIQSDDLDFVHRPEHLDTVIERIQARLSGREEIIF